MIALPRRLSLARVLRIATPFVLLSMMTALAACGGAEAKAPQTQEPRERRGLESENEPATVEEAQEQISRARDQLAAAKTEAQPGAAGSSPATTFPLPSPPPPPAAEPARPSDTSPRKSASPPKSGEEARCASPCRALASMRRAVTALCRMTGDADNRCLDAKRTLADSEGRIPPCSC